MFFSVYSFYVLLLHLPPLRYTVSEDAGNEPRTVAMFALAVNGLSNRSHPATVYLYRKTI